jgi:hypothetical protein
MEGNVLRTYTIYKDKIIYNIIILFAFYLDMDIFYRTVLKYCIGVVDSGKGC